MQFTNFDIPGHGSYVVTKSWLDLIVALSEKATEDTLSRYPDADISVTAYLTKVGPKIIAVIKEYRNLSQKSLRDSKHVIDRVRGGEKFLLGTFSWHEARKIAEKFREAGATIALPSPLEMLARQAE